MTATIFVTDDEPAIRSALVKRLSRRHHRVMAFESGEDLLQALDHEVPDVMLLDVKMPGLSGLEALKACRVKAPFALVIMLTAYGTVQDAVEAMKLGAYDFVIKTVDLDGMEQVLDRALELFALRRRLSYQSEQDRNQYAMDHLIADSPAMKSLLEQIREVAHNPKSTVLMLGETGTGKEFVARVLHHNGTRASGPFVGVNCTAIPRDLFESELFGYERGAFTGADRARPGKIELASTGTLFLDEIENMPLSMQAKLLLVLNDQRVQRLGSSRWTKVDMRIIAASNVPLRSLVAQDKMRRDFFYRINVIPIRLIPLRQRLNDIPLLVQDFLRHHRVALEKQVNKISPRAMAQLMGHDWPGNVRELQNVLEKAIVLTRSRVIEELELADSVGGQPAGASQIPMDLPLPEWIKHQEKQYLMGKLEAAGGRIDLTARFSGVDVRTIHRKMKLYGLDKKVFQQKDLPRN